jgi:hypothetical protein
MTVGEWVLLVGLLAHAIAFYFGLRHIDNNMMLNTATISKLEKNTNSIKDALVKVTGESEHAKGLKQGRDEKAK